MTPTVGITVGVRTNLRFPHKSGGELNCMENIWLLASPWLGLALLATLLSICFHISTALSEIVVGTVAQLIIGAVIGQSGIGAKVP
jgi:hypothetical protein